MLVMSTVVVMLITNMTLFFVCVVVCNFNTGNFGEHSLSKHVC